jgi:hypothetical protein
MSHGHSLVRPLTLASFGASVVLIIAGCGSSPSGPAGSATSSEGGPGASAFAYARCMREHGVTGFPDPHVSVSGPNSGSVRMVVPASVGQDPHFKSASKACNGILPRPGQNQGTSGPKTQVFLAFARCLRAHGEPRFPDPGPQGQLTLSMIQAVGVDLHAPAFLAAARSCIGVTHGQISMAQVQELVHHTS